MPKNEYIFQIKYTETILSNSTRKLLWFEITKTLIAVQKINLLCYLLQFSAHFRSLYSVSLVQSCTSPCISKSRLHIKSFVFLRRFTTLVIRNSITFSLCAYWRQRLHLDIRSSWNINRKSNHYSFTFLFCLLVLNRVTKWTSVILSRKECCPERDVFVHGDGVVDGI